MMHQDWYDARGYSPEGQIYESQRPAQFGESRRSSGELRSVHDVGGASPIALTSSPTCHTCDEASHRNHMAGHPLGAMRVLSSRIGPKSEGETPPEVLKEGRDGSGLGAHRTCHPWRAE